MSLIEMRGGVGIAATGRSLGKHFCAASQSCHQLDPNVVVAQTSPQRLNVCRSLRIKSLRQDDDLVLIHMLRGKSGHGMTDAQARAEAYTACVHLDEFISYDIWCDERHESSRALGEGAVHINDMRHLWRADLRSPFHVVNFYITQSALDEVLEEYGGPSAMELRCPMSKALIDNVFKNLALALLPAIAHPDEANKLFLEHAARAVKVHLAKTYGSLRCQTARVRGGLAPWQERRAKDMLRADLAGNVGLTNLADACRLSVSHFCQAFKQTVGCPPHQWLISQRVERAKQLILNTDQSLSEIALAVGFSDQSHFTRVFSRWVRTSPAAWRRAQES
jgi:AraC-like DNA-binding protein